MLLHPIFTLANGVLSRIAEQLSFITDGTLSVGPVELPWPFPFLPPEPVITTLAVGTFATLFFSGLKLLRWIYGLTPVVQ